MHHQISPSTGTGDTFVSGLIETPAAQIHIFYVKQIILFYRNPRITIH